MCELCYVHKYRRLPDDQDPLEFHLQLLQPLIRTTTDSEQTSVGLNDTCVIEFTMENRFQYTNFRLISMRFKFFFSYEWPLMSLLLVCLFVFITGFLSLCTIKAFHSLFPIITYTQAYNLYCLYAIRGVRHRTIWRTLVANKLIKNVQKEKDTFSCQYFHNYHKSSW